MAKKNNPTASDKAESVKKNNSIAGETVASVVKELQTTGYKSIARDLSELEESDKREVVKLLNANDLTAYINNSGVTLIVERND